jgi:6-phosphogluconolactonase
MQRNVLRDFESADSLASSAANDVALLIAELIDSKSQVNVVVTGGTVGIKTLADLAPLLVDQDLTKLRIWFSDERFVERASADRNALQARTVLLDQLQKQGAKIFEFPAVEDGDIAEASHAFATAKFTTAPDFDLVLLGMGPDAHVASLFPGSKPDEVNQYIVIERDSPKPPSERISLSFRALNLADRVWFLVAGKDKSEAVKKVFAGEDLPAGKVRGRSETRWYLDKDAASEI